LDPSARPDDILRYVLGVLWMSVADPVIRLLKLEVIHFVTYSPFPVVTIFHRNLTLQ
jgi:hypothetical protein